MKTNIISKLSANFIPILACLFPIFCLAYGKGYKAIPVILLLFSLSVLFSTPRKILTKNVIFLILAFMLYFCIFVFSALLNGDSLSRLDGPSRFILCIPIFMAILRYPPPFSWITKSLVIASYISGAAALVLVFYYGQGRAFTSGNDFFSKGYMPIQSGNIAMTFGILCWPITIYYLNKSALIISIICSFGTAFGILASYLSGSRGGWVFVPIAILFLFYVNRVGVRKNSKKTLAFIILTMPTLFMLTVINMTPTMQEKESRLDDISRDINTYKEGQSSSSTGVRFELWRDSFYTFIEAPLIGVGYKERLELRAKWLKEGIVTLPDWVKGSHSHNQFFEALAVRGSLGFIGLMGIFATPLFIFMKINKGVSMQQKTVAQCGALSVIMMMGYCLTQAMFRHNSGAIFYPLLTVILLGFCLANTKAHDLEK